MRSTFHLSARARRWTKLLHVGVALIGVPIHHQLAAQTAVSQAFVDRVVNHAFSCFNATAIVPGPTAVSCGPVASDGHIGSASTTSDNTTRTITATSTLQQSGSVEFPTEAVARSTQQSQLFVAGTPGVGDQLVFHFLTAESLAGSGGFSLHNDAHWELVVYNEFGGAQAYVDQATNTDGTLTPLLLSSAAATQDGFDLTLPFTNFYNNQFEFAFKVTADTYQDRGMVGDVLSSAMTARLEGVDAVTAAGVDYASSTFNSATGTGSIDLTTTPEPTTTVLFGTGLLALAPIVRRTRTDD